MIRRLCRHIVVLTVVVMALLATLTATAQSIIYVNHSAVGADNGTSWEDAYTFVQDALQAAQSGDEVWVAQGIYRPDQGTGILQGDREASFVIPSGVSLYGGFTGTETARDQRDWDANETVLNGDLLGNDAGPVSYQNPLYSENSHHVVRSFDVISETVLDGVTVTGGMAIGGSGLDVGSGLQVETTNQINGPILIANCLFERNISVVGTLYLEGGNDSSDEPDFIIRDSIFRDNLAGAGAAISVFGSALVERVNIFDNSGNVLDFLQVREDNTYLHDSLVAYNTAHRHSTIESHRAPGTFYMWNTRVIGNTTTDWGSGGVEARLNFVSINNVFSGNASGAEGGALDLGSGHARIVNNIFAYNSAMLKGGAISTYEPITDISNSIFLSNSAPVNPEIYSWVPERDTIRISHSIIQHLLPSFVTDLGGVVRGNPFFADADGADNIPGTIDDDFRLTDWSSAIDSGVNDSLFADFWDLDGDGNLNELWPTDFLNHRRIFDGGSGKATVDMGAFEYDAPSVFTAVQTLADLPNSPRLQGNYPNPFNPSTTITYSLPRPADVRLEVFDLLGKRVRLLESGFKPGGQHKVTFDATGLGSGVYFYTLTAGDFSQTRKMVVVK